MGRIEKLIEAYGRFAALPWEHNLAGPQRVWFAVYDPSDERRLRFRLDEFEIETKKAGHGWKLVDLSGAFAEWLAAEDYRKSFFEVPDDLAMSMAAFSDLVSERLKSALEDKTADGNTVVAVHGISCLYGLTSVSDLVSTVESSIRGRLLVFFPGEFEDNNYRLLDARDGWNYLAVPITADEGVHGR